MRKLISESIVSRGFFVGTLVAIFGVINFAVPFSAFAVSPNPNPSKILSEDFESGNFSKWTECNDPITTSQVHSGSRALHFNGWPGCYTYHTPTREVYFRFWWYIPAGFTWNTTGVGGRHYWRLGYGSGGSIQIEQIDTGPGYSPNNIDLVFHLGDQNGNPVYRNAGTLPQGRWFKFEFYVRLNDPGVANGETAVWIDGVQQSRKTNVNLNATSHNFNVFQLTTNYSNCTGICDWYMDDVEVWNGCPSGASCNGAATPVSLSAPGNLRVVSPP